MRVSFASKSWSPRLAAKAGPSGLHTEIEMKKFLTLFAIVAFSAMALVTSTKDAEARRWHRGYGGAIAAAVVGGVILHSLHRRHHRRHYYSSYGDGYGYGYYPRHRRSYSSAYYNPYPYYGGRRFHRHKSYRHHRHGYNKHYRGGYRNFGSPGARYSH